MLAIICQKPLSTQFLRDFRFLAESGKVSKGVGSKGHKDGWGIVHFNKQPIDLGHRAKNEDGSDEANAYTSKEYENVCNEIETKSLSGIFLIHLRKASKGKKVRVNTAPFINGKWAFSHNGTVNDLKEGDKNDLNESDKSDSRILFKMLTKEIILQDNAEKGIRSVIKRIWASHGEKYTSLTFILSDGESLYAYRDYIDEENKDYYSLKYAFVNDSTLIFSQEEIVKADWCTIPNKTLVIAGKEPKIKKMISID